MEPLEFKNDQLHAVVIRKPACRIEMRIKVAPPLIQSAKREAVKAVGKEVLLPGFRRGRAPDEMILKKFPSEIERETHNKLAEAVFAIARDLTKIPLLNNNARVTFDLQKMDANGAELLFTFETEPQIPSVDPKRFQPKPYDRPPVGDKEIDEAIRQMQFYFAAWNPVMNRSVQENDYVMIDLDTVEGDVLQRVFNHVRFEVSKERMAEWMQNLVIGAKVGDRLEGMSEPDANATEEEKRQFTPKKVLITIVKNEKATLPPLDDEFAKKVGARDIAHMRETVSDMLNRQADEKAREALREQVNDFLIGEYPFELPQSLVQTEKEHRFRQLMQIPNFQRDWERMPREEQASYEQRMTLESEHAVRLFYLSRQVVREANIGITHTEVQNEAVATLRAHGAQQQVSLDQIPKEVYALSLSKIILARAQDHIIQTSAST